MKRIILLVDYKNHFGSKWDAIPYNSGFDKILLRDYFNRHGYEPEFVPLSKSKGIMNVSDVPILYTSSEDIGYHYKDFIEDIVYYLELRGGKLLPDFKHLRANNNKVFMELLRETFSAVEEKSLKSWVFGSSDEIKAESNDYPIVLKESLGAQSRGVFLANNRKELLSKSRKISRVYNLYQNLKDALRPLKHRNYTVQSPYRRKFILQEFIPDLKNDWKILIFGSRLFVLTRHTKEGDFRASGSRSNYLAGSKSLQVEGLFDFAYSFYKSMNVPNVSLDVIYDGHKFYIVEFQSVYFGTSTINMSDVYYERKNRDWIAKKSDLDVEQLYVDSIIDFLK